uniref:Protein kinase domain-containing protein n=1 Tax=Mastacembelus armatus TaxID=205130 RepID=A0A3Q3MM65_9TELE
KTKRTSSFLTRSPCSRETILVKKRDLLFSNSTRYLVMDLIGEGGYGLVVKCLNLITGKTTAVKIHKDGESKSILRELEMLEAIRSLDTEKKNIIKFIEDFKCHDCSCLAFEMLDKSLWDLMEEEGMPLSLNEIRPVTQQLMVAFEALKGLGIMHLDMKPDNVMLVNHKDQPFRIKLIDFGLAHPVGALETGTVMQVLAYRAPEIMLGLPLSEAVDIWGVGCIMAYMYFGDHLFPFEYQLNDAMYTWKWRLKTPGEYKDATGVRAKVLMTFFEFSETLEDAVEGWSEKQDGIEYEDTMAFLSLLKGCLHVDPARRICPGEALKHRFITMAHLVDEMGTTWSLMTTDNNPAVPPVLPKAAAAGVDRAVMSAGR